MKNIASRGSGADSVLSDPVIRRLAIVVILGSIMSLLDTTIVNVAIETLSRDFHSPLATIQWVTTGYLLALAIVIPLSGWLIERFGTKEMWMVSLALFTLGSVLCAAAWSSQSLIAFRVMQGLGGGMIMPIGQTILARAAGPRRMGRIMSIIGIPTLVAPILGPVIGGLIVDNLTWRWIFLVNVPIGVLALVLSQRYLAYGERQDAGRLDLRGALLLSPGLAILVYGLSEAGGGSGFGSTKVLFCLAAGAVLIGAFVIHATRVDRPLLDMHLFRDRSFSMANLTIFVFGGSLYAAMFLLPLYYQVVRGESALTAGLLMAPQGVGAMLTMPWGGRLTDRLGPRGVVPIGMAIFLLGTVGYTQIGPDSGYTFLTLALFVRGLGMGWTMMPTMSAAYASLTRALVPRATTTINIVMRVGGSFGTALVAIVLQRQIADRLPRSPAILSSGASVGGQLPAPIASRLADSFAYSFWVVVAVTAVGLVGSLLLPKGTPSLNEDPAGGDPSDDRLAVIGD
ncbi:MAG TPA: DHA2 family efflux MFS transporter permease subunit [Acidimicrobiales bacterium]|nr:DHA2 family efflux MFS transporter permease subunit [Acidimicrobiales bacterium]